MTRYRCPAAKCHRARRGTYSTDPYFCNAVLKSAMLSAYLVTSVGRKVIVEGFEREDRRASAALVARSPKTMEAPASWSKRTVAAPMPFAPPKVDVLAPKTEEGGDAGGRRRAMVLALGFCLARKRSTYPSRRQPFPSIC
jgi:hypothetical protein